MPSSTAPADQQQQPSQQTDTALIAALVVILLSGLTLDSLVRHVAALLVPLGYPVAAVAGVVGLIGTDDDFAIDTTDTATGLIARGTAVRHANYILAAVRRLAAGGSLEEERKFLRLHRGAERARKRAAAQADAVVRATGSPVLGWKAKMDARTTPDCAVLHGSNFHVLHPPGGTYPGQRHGGNCRCVSVPAWPT